MTDPATPGPVEPRPADPAVAPAPPPMDPGRARPEGWPPTPAGSSGPPGWIPPGGPGQRSRGRTLAIVGCAVLAIVLSLGVSATIALVFLGSQVEQVLGGTVDFGTGGTGCSVTGTGTQFQVGQPIHVAAHLKREVPAGETVTVRLITGGSVLQSGSQSFATAGRCVYLDLPTTSLGAAAYRLEYLSGTEILSSGSFTLTP